MSKSGNCVTVKRSRFTKSWIARCPACPPGRYGGNDGNWMMPRKTWAEALFAARTHADSIGHRLRVGMR